MYAEHNIVFMRTKSGYIKLYNDYIMLVREVCQDIEVLLDKATRLHTTHEQLKADICNFKFMEVSKCWKLGNLKVKSSKT